MLKISFIIGTWCKNNNTWVIVGGDFKKEELNTNHNFYSIDEGKNWLVPTTPIRGYRECVESVTKNILIATGPSGVDISLDNSVNWESLSEERGLHVLRKARKGSLMIAAGAKGEIFLVQH